MPWAFIIPSGPTGKTDHWKLYEFYCGRLIKFFAGENVSEQQNSHPIDQAFVLPKGRTAFILYFMFALGRALLLLQVTPREERAQLLFPMIGGYGGTPQIYSARK